jgi:isocitrate dehydrogenase
VTCLTKDNIMKMTDGLFHKVYDQIGTEYPDIEKEHWIIDIGSALLADDAGTLRRDCDRKPLRGHHLRHCRADCRLGRHGRLGQHRRPVRHVRSHPRLGALHCRQGIANPSGLLNGAIMMLVHINQPEVAAKVHNAWLATIEAGIHTGDIYKEGVSKRKVGTKEFADAVIERLGVTPNLFNTVSYQAAPRPIHSDGVTRGPKKQKELVGVDVFLDWWNGNANDLGKIVEGIRTKGSK